MMNQYLLRKSVELVRHEWRQALANKHEAEGIVAVASRELRDEAIKELQKTKQNLEKMTLQYDNALADLEIFEVDNRRKFKQELREGWMGDDPCTILYSERLRETRVLENSSCSDSIIIKATTDIDDLPTKIIFKITFHYTTKMFNMLLDGIKPYKKCGAHVDTYIDEYEMESYVYKILSTYDFPFVMQHYHTYECTDFMKKVLKFNVGTTLKNVQLKDEIKRAWYKLSHQDNPSSCNYNFNKARIVLTERGTYLSLHNLINEIKKDPSKNLGPGDWKAIFIQATFCLAFFEDLGIMHHDLHLGNVWIDKAHEEVQYILHFKKNSEPTVITTKYIVKIFDFDNATMVETDYCNFEVKNNIKLEDMCMYGMCNDFAPGRDYAQFCWWLWRANRFIGDELCGIIRKTVDVEFLYNKGSGDNRDIGQLVWHGHPYKVSQFGACEGYKLKGVKQLIREEPMMVSMLTSGACPPSLYRGSHFYLPSTKLRWWHISDWRHWLALVSQRMVS